MPLGRVLVMTCAPRTVAASVEGDVAPAWGGIGNSSPTALFDIVARGPSDPSPRTLASNVSNHVFTIYKVGVGMVAQVV